MKIVGISYSLAAGGHPAVEILALEKKYNKKNNILHDEILVQSNVLISMIIAL